MSLHGLVSSERSRARAAVVAGNLVPLVGVALLGWSAAELYAIYVVELGVFGLFTLVRALFASRPFGREPGEETLFRGLMDLRGGYRVGGHLVLSPRNLQYVLTFAPVYAVYCVATAGIAGGAFRVAHGGPVDASSSLVFGIAGLFVGQAGSFASEFVRGEGDDGVDARAVCLDRFSHSLVTILAVGAVGGPLLIVLDGVSSPTAAAVGLSVVVLSKTAADLWEGTFWSRADEPTADSLPDPAEGAPTGTVTVRPAGAFVARAGELAGGLALVGIAFVPLAAGLSAALYWSFDPELVARLTPFPFAVDLAAVPAAAVVGYVALAVGGYVRLARHAELRFYEGHADVYDREFEAVRRRIEYADVSGVQQRDGGLGSHTVAVRCGDETVEVHGLDDPDTAVEAFERAAKSADTA